MVFRWRASRRHREGRTRDFGSARGGLSRDVLIKIETACRALQRSGQINKTAGRRLNQTSDIKTPRAAHALAPAAQDAKRRAGRAHAVNGAYQAHCSAQERRERHCSKYGRQWRLRAGKQSGSRRGTGSCTGGVGKVCLGNAGQRCLRCCAVRTRMRRGTNIARIAF